MINVTDLRECVIEKVLSKNHPSFKSAVNLLLGIAAQESGMGTYLRQRNNGPARGIYQCEESTYNDVWTFIQKKFHQGDLPDYISTKGNYFPYLGMSGFSFIEGNLYYATIICRMHFVRFQEPLPTENDIPGMARYWKRYYNTNLGKGTEEQFVENYKKYVSGK